MVRCLLLVSLAVVFETVPQVSGFSFPSCTIGKANPIFFHVSNSRIKVKSRFPWDLSSSIPSDASTSLAPSTFEERRQRQRHVADSEKQPTDELSSQRHYDAVVVGGGPAGLLSAIMLARLPPLAESSQRSSSSSSSSSSPRIIVYDRLPPPPSPSDPLAYSDVSKYYLLGLGHRGQKALRHFDVMDDVSAASVEVLGRRDWSPGKTREEDGNVRLSTDKAVNSRILAREKLVGVLKEVLQRDYAHVVELRYGYQVDPLSFGNELTNDKDAFNARRGSGPPVTLRVSRCVPTNENEEECTIQDADDHAGEEYPITITTNFLIGADGAARTIANAMEKSRHSSSNDNAPSPMIRLRQTLFGPTPFRVKRYDDDNPRVYKSIPIQFPPHWRSDLNYSARSRNSRVSLEGLPSDNHGNYCALLLMRPHDMLAKPNCDPIMLRNFFNEEFPQFSVLIKDEVMETVAKKGASALPGFRYAGPRLHEGSRTVILGDCIHTVKPYYGLGANTALEDVQILSQILSSTPNLSQNLHKAVQEFSSQRAADSRALVTMSRSMDRPGKLGTMRFILPLILDSTFHKFAPKLFAPNMFGMFQKEGMRFRNIQLRKRLDRTMQFCIISTVLSGIGWGVNFMNKCLARRLGMNELITGTGLAGMVGMMGLSRRVMSKLSKNENN